MNSSWLCNVHSTLLFIKPVTTQYMSKAKHLYQCDFKITITIFIAKGAAQWYTEMPDASVIAVYYRKIKHSYWSITITKKCKKLKE